MTAWRPNLYCDAVRFVLEPLAAVRDPPGEKQNRDGRGQAPPNWEHEIREQAENSEHHPKDFSFDPLIVGECTLSLRVTTVTKSPSPISLQLQISEAGVSNKSTKSCMSLIRNGPSSNTALHRAPKQFTLRPG